MDSRHYSDLIPINATVSDPRADPALQDGDDKGVVIICLQGFDFASINATFFWIIFIVSIIGNGLLLHILFHYENLRNVTNLFVVNLTCSDLVFTITLPFWAFYHTSEWIFGDFACKFVTAAYFVGLYSSIILLTTITIDRFTTLVLQNRLQSSEKRQKCAIGACAGAWIISFAASLREAVNTKVGSYNGLLTCDSADSNSESNLGIYLQVSLLFFLPFVIIVFCYSAILRKVMNTSNRRKLRTVLVVLCIVFVFFVCWGPHHVMILLHTLAAPQACDKMDNFYLAYDIFRLLAYSHCCMNPLLYMLSQKLRRHLVQLFRCKRVRRRMSLRGSRQSSSNVFQNGLATTNVLELQSR
ncbi:chemokine XC receptor 1-like [Genypterus blacodes]|uniref:chemokine XC receptor 1-like n=1 Tax=Genypterus blacodes TaxID=154954 RepID=UPI003F75E4A6